MRKTMLLASAVIALAGCGRSVVVTNAPEPAASTKSGTPSTAATLGIPPGHLPPPGRCRVWRPGVPPGHQDPPGDCAIMARRVPAGGWLVFRPSKHRKEVEVSVYHSRRPNVVVVVRLFDARSGKLLRERAP